MKKTADERVDELLSYEKDWDSYGAPPLDPEVLERVRVLACMVEKGWFTIMPISGGGAELQIGETGDPDPGVWIELLPGTEGRPFRVSFFYNDGQGWSAGCDEEHEAEQE